MTARRLNAAPERVRSWRQYQSYRDSLIEWQGRVPAHWKTVRVAECATVINGYPFDSEYFVRTEGVPLVRIRDLFGSDTEVNYIGPIVESAWVETGDVLVGMDGDFNVARWQGARALLNQRMCRLRPGPHLNPRFLTYLLPFPLKVINDLTYSTTVKHLSSGDIRKIRYASPSPEEQQAIADFLDRETANIAAVIASNERLLDLLQEERSALISRAVTKGLDANVRMKESRVEWLGKTPSHWNVTTLKRLGAIQAGVGFPEEEQGLQSEAIPFFKVGDMGSAGNEREMLDGPNTVSAATASRLGACVFPPQTIVFAKVGAALKLNRRRLLIRPSCLDNNMMGFIPKHCDPSWAFYWLSGLDLGELANPGAVPSVNESQVRDIPVAAPPLAEQRTIAEFLDRKTARIDTLVAEVLDAIVRLRDLKTSLISAAVTGKIDVREDAE